MNKTLRRPPQTIESNPYAHHYNFAIDMKQNMLYINRNPNICIIEFLNISKRIKKNRENKLLLSCEFHVIFLMEKLPVQSSTTQFQI